MPPFVWKMDDQWNPDSTILKIAFASGCRSAVIRIVEDNGIFGESGFPEFIKDPAHLFVHRSHAVLVNGRVFAKLGQIRLVRWKLDGIGCDSGWIRDQSGFAILPHHFGKQVAFMGDGEVENREERLAIWAVLIVGVSAALIPDGCVISFEIIVGLRVVGAIVTRFPQISGMPLEIRGNVISAAHVLGALGDGIGTVEDGGSRHCAHRAVRISVGELQAIRRKGIQHRSGCLLVAVTGKPVRGVVLAGDPEDVGALLCESGNGGEEQDR